MFKRVDKKRKKQEEEEELGLDEDMKDIMGLNDTDSDESASDSDIESDVEVGEKDLRGDGDDETGDEMEDDGNEMEDDGNDDELPISLSEALRDPVYVVSLDPDVRACILCKGKVIKGVEMSKVHKKSTAHKRRFERFKSLSANSDQQTDAWQVARTIQKEASNPAGTLNRADTEGGLSKRVLKRTAKHASITEKRMLHKKLRAKHSAKKSSQPQNKAEASPATELHVKQKSQNAGAAVDDKKIVKGEQKAAPSKPHDVEKLDASPLTLLEPRKKRKMQKNHVMTSSVSSRDPPPRMQEKPLGKPKAPREKERKRTKAA